MKNLNYKRRKEIKCKNKFLLKPNTIYNISRVSGEKGIFYCNLLALYMKDVNNTVLVLSKFSRWLNNFGVKLRTISRWCVRRNLYVVCRDKNIMYSPKTRTLMGLSPHPSDKEIAEAKGLNKKTDY